jgi:predicted transcriptional regulator
MKSGSFLKRMDYTEMEARFSNEHAIKYDEFKDFSIAYDEIRPFLYRLPPREIDLIELYYNERKNQKDIAKIFGVTQGAISSRLTRAKKRLRFLRNLPKITDDEIDGQLGVFFEPLELEIIKYMMKTTCQSKTAQLINEKFNFTDGKKKMTQVKVRHRFEKCLIKIEAEMKIKAELKKFYTLLSIIKNNLYLLHEVKLPHFDRGAHALFSLYV